MPSIPFVASSKEAYLTKPNPLEYPEALSVTTLAVDRMKIVSNLQKQFLRIKFYATVHTLNYFTKLGKGLP